MQALHMLLPVPYVANGTTWFDKHPQHDTPGQAAKLLGLCLYGIPAIQSGKAGHMDVSTEALQKTSSSHVRFLLEPAEEKGVRFEVFAHAWLVPKVRLAEELYAAYGHRLKGLQLDALDKELNRVPSMTRSIVRSLALARSGAATTGTSHDLILAMRHDVFWVATISLAVPPTAFTVATWANEVSPCCFELVSYDGVHDLWWLGSPTMLEFVFLTLLQRLEHKELLPNASNFSGWWQGHYVVQNHLDYLELTSRGLVRSHPAAFSGNGAFCLYGGGHGGNTHSWQRCHACKEPRRRWLGEQCFH